MTDYDATIKRLKLDALRALKTEVHLPFAVPPGDAPGAWDRVLNKVVAPALGELLSALIMRDTWETRTNSKQEQIDRWIRSCLEVQTELEKANRRIGELEDQLNVANEGLQVEKRWRETRGQLPADEDKAVAELMEKVRELENQLAAGVVR